MKLMCLNGEEFPVKETRHIEKAGEFFYWDSDYSKNTWYVVQSDKDRGGSWPIKDLYSRSGRQSAAHVRFCILDMEPITLAGDPII